MDTSTWNHYDFFASNILRDVCAYFLKKLHFFEKEYTTQRSLLYSEYGQKILIQCLDDLPLEFFIELENIATLQRIDDSVFDETVATIIQRSGWTNAAHVTFYETCAKIIILGIVALDHGCFTETKIHHEIVKMAKQAYDIHKLDEHYDMARKNVHSIFYTVFRILGTDINEFSTPVEREIGGFDEFIMPESLINYTIESWQNNNNILSSNEYFKIMNRDKFNFLLKISLKRARDGISNAYIQFLALAINIGCISLFSANNSFKAGVQQGLDFIVEFILMEKHLLIH